jgi:hypothetical protein
MTFPLPLPLPRPQLRQRYLERLIVMVECVSSSERLSRQEKSDPRRLNLRCCRLLEERGKEEDL